MIDAFELRAALESLAPRGDGIRLACLLRAAGGLCADAPEIDPADAENGMGLCDPLDAVQTASRLSALAGYAIALARVASDYAYRQLDAE